MPDPAVVLPDWAHQYRIVSSEYPPINFFEELVDPELMDALFYIEGLTNDRLRDAVGEISLVAVEDRVSGPGSTPLMSAFTHVGVASRFSDGSYGVYYASDSLHTAIAETRFHRERFLAYTAEEPGEIDVRAYVGEIVKPLHDIRDGYPQLHDPDVANYPVAQAFGRALRERGSWGIVYDSVRDRGGQCIAALRPPALTIPRQGPHLSYVWDGARITRVYEKTRLL
ncbi:MAG: RES family NAD+ phosphorylase [Gammaproteobacteria bacterium]|nr:RES family NAD+ phosphorylase [Gammaproteobacteria bacterium]